MKDFYSKKSKENGITLVALVVTIIVLLIMATITIYNIAGDDSSLLTSVETQREDLLKMEAKQAIEVAAEKVKLKNAGTSLKFKDFKDQLKEELQKDDADSEVISSDFSSDDNTPMYDATFNGYTFSYFYVEDINNLIEITYKQDKEKYTQSGNAKITTTVEEAKILYYYFEGIKPEEITAKELANIKWNTYDLDATAEYPLSIKCNGTLYAKLDINGSSSDSIYKQVINIDCLQPIIENVNVDNKVYGQLTFKADITDAPETAKSLSSGIQIINLYLDNKIIKTFDATTNNKIEYTHSNLALAQTYKYHIEAIDNVGNKTTTDEKEITVLGEFDLQIKHYFENIDDNKYTLSESDTQKSLVEYGKTLNVSDYVIKKEGFTYEYASLTASESGAETQKIETPKMGAGMTIALYYSRNPYTLTLGKGENIKTVTGAGIYKFGKEVNILAELAESAEGYTNKWDKWTSDNEELLKAPTTQTAKITMPIGNIELTAHGTISNNTYQIMYDGNGSTSGTMTNSTHTYDVESNLTKNAYIKTGYNFTGWNTKADGTGDSYTDGAAIKNLTSEQNGTVTLYAQWEAKTIKVTFMRNTTSDDTTNDIQTFTYGVSNQKFSEKGWIKEGYTLIGWSTNKDASEKQWGTLLEVGNDWINNRAPEIILYAVWQINEYNVTYDYATNGGTSATKTSAQVNYNEEIDLTPTATKVGYKFVGWNTDKNATTGLTSLKMGTSNVTLYAIYSKEITVTYKYYNNQTTTETKTVYNKTTSATFTLKEALGTPEGYTFRGWSETDAANATVLTESKVTLTASKTYCASYETTVEATFHYCYSEANKIYAYTYGTTTTTGRKYMGYAGAIVHSEIVVPDIVKNNGNYYSTEYGGVAIEPSSTDGVTPTTEHTVYYAFYQGPLTYYYYDGINHISSTTNKNVILNGTKATIKIDNVPTPSKYDEAEYKGWSWKKDSVEDRKPAQTSVTELYAYYKKTITATFNYHNGTEAASETATSTIIYISQAVDTIPNVINNEITIPDVVKENRTINSVVHTYRGISTSSEVDAEVITTPTTANATYYASYTYPIKVSYNANGGTGTAPTAATGTGYMKYEGTKIGITITTATNPFTRAEYLFKNWNTKADGTGTSYAEGAKATFTGNATLYAIWDKAYYQNTTSEKYYITLKDAVNGSATGTEIIAIDNATETVTATIPKVKTLTLNINGKTITFNGANNINNNGTLTITGGTIDGKNSTVNCIYNTGELTISGSTTNIYGRTNGTNRVINNQSTGKINMLEGKVIASESNDGALLNYGNFNMTGGELTTGGTSTGKTIWNEGTIEISGGKITASGSSEGVLINKGNFNMTGGTIDGRSAVGHCIVNNGELTISGSSTYIHGCGKYVSLQNKGSATINGGYIYGYEETCIWNYTDAKCNINGGTFESEEIRTVYNQGILNITAGYFKNSGTNVNNNSGVLSNATEGIAEITGGTFDAKDSKTSCMINEGKLTLGDNNEPVSTEVPELIGNKNGIHVESESEFNFYDGIIKGATAIYGTVTDTPTGYGVVTSTTDGIQAATLSNKYTLTVKHYLENADNTNYTEVPTAKTTKEVTYGDIITLANHETTITNGTYSYGSLTESTTRATSSKETTITEDTTIVLYYTRKTYTLTLNKDSNVDSVSGGGKHKVGARIQIQATMKSSTDSYTYSFTGWTGDDTSVVENTQENPTYVTMPSKDITLKVNGKQSTKIITY